MALKRCVGFALIIVMSVVCVLAKVDSQRIPPTPPPPPPPTPLPPPPFDRSCFSNANCTKSEYCRWPVGICTDAFGKPFGECVRTPEICTLEYSPVCGCDQRTYSNMCSAAANRTSIQYHGACIQRNTCNSNNQCSGTNQFCRFAFGSCGRMNGTCDGAPMICPSIYAPVCACNGVTYSNDCGAYAMGQSVDYPGPCRGTGSSCQVDSDCSGPQSFCELKNCQAPGYCTVAPQFCTHQYAPVCSCSGRTYSNGCYAQAAYSSVAYFGACNGTIPSPPPSTTTTGHSPTPMRVV